MLDLAIIGGGAAALSAALYAARAGLTVTVYEKNDFGGILPQIAQLENYPGYLGPGQKLAASMRAQATAAGAQLQYGECTNLDRVEDHFELIIDGESVLARTVLVATGSQPKSLSFTPSAPVSYCALCDGPLVQAKRVAVIGGANSAAQEALYLAHLAAQVTIITHSQLKADQELIDRVREQPNIEIIEHLEPTPENLSAYDHIFVYIGKIPATSFLDRKVLDGAGYVITDTNSSALHQTIIPGLFAAGDVRQGSVKQVVTAAADGAAAAIEISTLIRRTG